MFAAAIAAYKTTPIGAVVTDHQWGNPTVLLVGINATFAPTTDPPTIDVFLAGNIGFTQPALSAVDSTVTIPGVGQGTAAPAITEEELDDQACLISLKAIRVCSSYVEINQGEDYTGTNALRFELPKFPAYVDGTPTRLILADRHGRFLAQYEGAVNAAGEAEFAATGVLNGLTVGTGGLFDVQVITGTNTDRAIARKRIRFNPSIS